MSDKPAEPAAAEPVRLIATSLTSAIRRARLDEAERSDVIAELRGAELARLEMLEERIEPVLAQVPKDVDLFDTGIIPGAHPRLFIDMIAFVEMARDRRTYRFVQDARHGRVTIAESEKLETMVEAVTAYIARRLVEREKALAAGETPAHVEATAAGKAAELAGAPRHNAAAPAAAPPRRHRRSRFAEALDFLLKFLGSVTFFTALALGAWMLWERYVQFWWMALVASSPRG